MQTAFFVRVEGRLKYFPFEDVLFISARDNYCEIVTVDQKKWLTHLTLTYLEQKLPENLFLRVHRSYIISLRKIDWLDHNLVIIGKHEISVSRRGCAAIKQRTLIVCPEYDKELKREVEGMTTDQYLKEVKSKRKEG